MMPCRGEASVVALIASMLVLLCVTAKGEGIIELEVQNLYGECMLTLHMSDSMYGRDLWKMIWTSLCPTSFSTRHDHSSIQAKPSVGCVSQDWCHG